MYTDDMTDDISKSRWLPPEGWIEVEVVKMVDAISKQGNPKFTVDFASTESNDSLQQDLTNIPGKRWLLRQLLEAAGIEPEENEVGRKIYNWNISDIEGRKVMAEVKHEPNDWIDRSGKTHNDKQARFVSFKKITV